jgi:hypothetical protein
VRRVTPLDAVADHCVHRTRAGLQPLEEARHLAQIELEVAIAEADELAARIGEPGAQRAAIAPIFLVVHADAGLGRRQLIGQCGGSVGRAVVDDEDLDRSVDQRSDLVQRATHRLDDVLLLVEGRKEERQARPLRIGHSAMPSMYNRSV